MGRGALCLGCPSTGSLRPLESLPVEASLSFSNTTPPGGKMWFLRFQLDNLIVLKAIFFLKLECHCGVL